ncbi:MAG: TerB family tellurite resistance protein [Gammaproteobacteria bacterium]|nr:TerB family tellurite resistance protein [Gammaproteobacteria bacterium]
MLAAIQSYIESTFSHQSASDEDKQYGLQLAAAALLVEVAAADFKQQPEERITVGRALQSSFDLTDENLQQLLSNAEQYQQDATSLYEFTSVLNEHCSRQEKFAILVNLWRVAFADGKLDKYEDHRIRRIAELLHFSPREFIQAKLQVAT